MAFVGEVGGLVATSRNCDDDELSWELGGFGAAGQGGTKGDDSEVLFTPLQTASVEWTSAGTKALAGAKALSADVLVVALEGPGACFLNAACTAKGGDLATVSVAIQASTASAGASAGAGGGAGAGAGAGGASAGAGGSVAAAKPVDDIVTGAVLTVQELAAGSSTVLLAVGTQAVSREAAPAVAAALLGAVSAKRILVLGALTAAPSELRDATSVTSLLRALKTDTVPAADVSAVASLPAPVLVGGLAAAVVSHCQVHGLPSVALFSLWSGDMERAVLEAFTPALDLLHAWAPTSATAGVTAAGGSTQLLTGLRAQVDAYRTLHSADSSRTAAMYV